jgi:class 3 adenylate cyclase
MSLEGPTAVFAAPRGRPLLRVAEVRGFTTISEGLDPNALREYINLYLTAMSEDIRGNRGTLDKYIGDASWPSGAHRSPCRTMRTVRWRQRSGCDGVTPFETK